MSYRNYDSVGVTQTPSMYRRFFRTDWSLSDDKVELIIPEKGRVITAISMGYADESGGVQVQAPDYPGDTPFSIGPHSPFVGNIIQPFRIRPTAAIPAAVYGDAARMQLDLLLWYDFLPVCGIPLRGPKIVVGSIAAGGGNTARIITAGRRRVSIYMLNGSANPITASILETFYTPLSGPSSAIIYNNAIPAGTSDVYELDAANTPLPAPNSKVSTMPFQITLVNGSATDPLEFWVEARDY